MKKIIREILEKFLKPEIVDKIEISSVVSRNKKQYKARGIPELLIKSLNLMGRSISSATFKNISKDIEQLCKMDIFRNDKINYLNLVIKDEMEVLKRIKFNNINEDDNYFNIESFNNRNLSQNNIYNQVYNYENDFKKIIATKFIDIYNRLNDTNYFLEEQEQSQILKNF